MKHVKLIISIWTTTFVYVIGGIDVALKCLLILIGVDYFTGVSKAYYNNKLSSYRGLKGVLKKLNILAMVIVANVIDELLGQTGAIRTLTIYYINLIDMNKIVPDWLKKKLIQVKMDAENGSSNS